MLRSLRKGVEGAWSEAGWDKKVAGALRRAFREDRRFDFEEALGVHDIAHGLHDAMTQAQIAAHLLTSQVEVAVGEAEVFVGNLVVELEWQHLGRVQDVER